MKRAAAFRIAVVLVVSVLFAAGCSLGERNVRPGFNESFLAPDMDVTKYQKRFESESREIFIERSAIALAVALRPGQAVADIGAGTGIFLEPFSRAVGDSGRVVAVEIAPNFVTLLEDLAKERSLGNVDVVLCGAKDCMLPPSSIDVAFICDTYHHFEYPLTTMRSIHRALRPGGQVFVVEFIRIEGVSRDWVLDHVRAGEEEFADEIESAGFRRVPQEQVPGLKENYVMRFIKE